MRFLIVLALLCPIFSFSQQHRSKPLAPLSPVNGQRSTLNPSPLSSVNSHPSSPPPTVNGQRSSLTIGDTLPVQVFQLLQSTGAGSLLPLPGGGRGEAKLMILDFWATWCTSCLHSFPRLDSLQQASGGNLQVLLVNEKGTGDNDAKLQAYWARHRRKDGAPFNFGSLLFDTTLAQFFPHQLLPHYVWLGPGGRVLAITGSDELTAANIRTALTGGPLNLPLKSDAPFQSSPTEPAATTAAPILFRSTLRPYTPGRGTGGRKTSDSLSQTIVFTNHSILSLYGQALGFSANRVVLEVRDSTPFLEHNGRLPNSARYTYELLAPLSCSRQTMYAIMHQDLDRYLGLHGRIERRCTPCWVLQRSPNFNVAQLLSKGERPRLQWAAAPGGVTTLTNQPLAKLVEALNTATLSIPPPPIVIDETGITANVNLELHAGLSDLPALRKELARYGLDLVPAVRQLNVFVLSEAPPDPIQTNPVQNHPPPNENEQPQTKTTTTDNKQ